MSFFLLTNKMKGGEFVVLVKNTVQRWTSKMEVGGFMV